MNLLVTFFSVSAALYSQKLLEQHATKCTVVPIPRSVSSSCGYALFLSGLSKEPLADYMNSAGIDWESIYQQSTDENKEYYVQILAPDK